MHGTGTGAWEGSVTLATTQSGSTFSMRAPGTTNLSCQNASNNTIFTGPDDVWGNGNGTDRETGCVDALYAARDRGQDAVAVARPQRHGRQRRRVADPRRPERRQRLLRRHPGPDRPQQRRPVDRLRSTWSATRWVTASTTTPPVASPAAAPRSSWRTRSARRPSGSPTTRPTRRTSRSAKRSTWSAAARSASCTTRRRSVTPTATPAASPVAEVHAAAGPGDHWFYLRRSGHQRRRRPAGQPDLQRHHRSPVSASRTP